MPLPASESIRLSAGITIEKGIDYQAFRSNFPRYIFPLARRRATAGTRPKDCVTTMCAHESTLVGRTRWIKRPGLGRGSPGTGKWEGHSQGLPTRKRFSVRAYRGRSVTSLRETLVPAGGNLMKVKARFVLARDRPVIPRNLLLGLPRLPEMRSRLCGHAIHHPFSPRTPSRGAPS